MRHYDYQLVEALQLNAHKGISFDFPIIIKDIPEGQSAGVLDPREFALAKQNLNKRLSRPMSIEAIRASAGYKNEAINKREILTSKLSLSYKQYPFEVFYDVVKDNDNQILPAIIYAHGGSFFTLSGEFAQNMCQSLADITNARIFNVDYSLAPEFPFPIGLRQYETAVKYVLDHAVELKVDPKRIILMGDSSGGNFASQIAHKYSQQIALQVLYYPAIYLDESNKAFEWNLSEFDIDPNYKEFIEPRLSLGRMDEHADKSFVYFIFKLYLQNNESCNIDELNSFYLDPKKFPRTLIFTSEYDGLRIQDELFAKKLAANGIETKVIRYRGIHHAFIEKVGYFPQAEDSFIEIANEIKLL